MKQASPAGGADDQPLQIPKVHNGTYTVANGTEHFTIKLHTVVSGGLAGKRILSMLVGPDNVSDYTGVAFWNDSYDQENTWDCYVSVWNRFKGPNSRMRVDCSNWQERGWSTVERKLAIWCGLAVLGDGGNGEEPRSYWGGDGYTLLLEGRCMICNRALTDPESIQLGIGPVCRTRTT